MHSLYVFRHIIVGTGGWECGCVGTLVFLGLFLRCRGGGVCIYKCNCKIYEDLCELCVALCCAVLRCVALRCTVLHCVAPIHHKIIKKGRVAAECCTRLRCVLHCVAVCCTVLHCVTPAHHKTEKCCCRVLQSLALCCVECCRVLSLCCSALRCAAVCCSALHYFAPT